MREDDGAADEGEVHAAWTVELQRRWDEVRSGEVEALTLEQFRHRVRARRETHDS